MGSGRPVDEIVITAPLTMNGRPPNWQEDPDPYRRPPGPPQGPPGPPPPGPGPLHPHPPPREYGHGPEPPMGPYGPPPGAPHYQYVAPLLSSFLLRAPQPVRWRMPPGLLVSLPSLVCTVVVNGKGTRGSSHLSFGASMYAVNATIPVCLLALAALQGGVPVARTLPTTLAHCSPHTSGHADTGFFTRSMVCLIWLMPSRWRAAVGTNSSSPCATFLAHSPALLSPPVFPQGRTTSAAADGWPRSGRRPWWAPNAGHGRSH